MKKSLLILLICVTTTAVWAQRKMENLGRGVVVTRTANNEALVSWRIKGTEPQDRTFNVYRSVSGGALEKLNDQPVQGATLFYDKTFDITKDNTYFVRGLHNGVELQEGKANQGFTLKANTPVQPYFFVPINARANYNVGQLWVGDLDGDGEYDFVFTRMPTRAEDPILLEAYLRDGTYLWTLDCGPNSLNRNNINPGSSALNVGHSDNVTVYDIDNDGKADVLIRTSNGVKFGDGTTLNHSDNNRQFISVLDGMTGREKTRADVPTDVIQYGPLSGHMGIAYLDGKNPSLIYSAKNRRPDKGFEMMVMAYSMEGSQMKLAWKYIRDHRGGSDGHNIRIADVDGDGIDEVIPWGYALNSQGKLKWILGDNAVHGDRFFIGKMDPKRPGLQGYAIQQDQPEYMYWLYYDARDGKVIHKQYGNSLADLARGMVGDFDPRHEGFEMWTFVDNLYNVQSGKGTANAMPSGAYPNLRIWWDGSLLSQNLDGLKFTKWDYQNSSLSRIYTAPWQVAAVLDRVVPSFYGDILGDWREEVIYAHPDQNALTIFTTPHPTEHRFYTLAHNPKYRADMTCRGYSQGHMLDYYLGTGMEQPPLPNIQVIGEEPAVEPMDCAGVANGTAKLDACGICVGGTTGRSPCGSVVQGEEFCTGDGVFEDTNEGFFGKGYFNLHNEVDTKVSYVLYAPAATKAKMYLRTANGGKTPRSLEITVNGNKVGVLTAEVGAWTQWSVDSVEIDLNLGDNTVLFNSLDADGGPNIDLIGFAQAGISKGNCEAITTNTAQLNIGDGHWRFVGGELRFSGALADAALTVQVFNLQGTKVFQGQKSNSQNTLRFTVPQGVYIVKTYDGLGYQRQQKIVVKD